jgi:CBS domain-containing protein
MKTTVKDFMTSRVIWVKPDAPYKEMATQGKVIGVVSEADPAVTISADAAAENAARLMYKSKISRLPVAFTVTVNDGVVTLTGVPETDEVGHQVVQRVRHVPGVVAVRDRLNYFPTEG